jgi:predicted AAA+ superfamily ATPase
MRTMSLVGSGDSSGAASLSDLTAGGWPGVIGLSSQDAQVVARGYIDRLANENMPGAAGVRRDSAKTRALLRSLARHTASPSQIPSLRRDMAQAFGATATDATIRQYMDDLSRR